MLIRELRLDEKQQYDQAVTHPLQTWEWGDFRETTGVEVVRLGEFEQHKLLKGFIVTFHPVPNTSYTIGYLPKSVIPDPSLFEALRDLGRRKKAIFIKIEPDIKKPWSPDHRPDFSSELAVMTDCLPGRPMFTKYNFILDLTKTEAELLAAMKPKTRYNLRLAEKKGVQVVYDNSQAAFAEYLQLMQETTRRQKFYAHSTTYHTHMWQTLQPAGIAHLLKAVYQGKTLVAWIVFKLHQTLYYPYGASSSEHREVMASNLMLWEAARFGQKMNCTSFDLWGCLGPDPDPKDPWFGFHRFKESYGPTMYENLTSLDYVINLPMYKLYQAADKLRWVWLRLKSSLP
jgi:lipid II:glycine glycyltransferase (peptidoglycan interpeptide bridge formation enzyme)